MRVTLILTFALSMLYSSASAQIIGNYTANRIIGGTKPVSCNYSVNAPDVWMDTATSPPTMNVCGSDNVFHVISGSGGTGTVTSVGNVNLTNFSNCTVSNPTTTPTWSCSLVSAIDLSSASSVVLPPATSSSYTTSGSNGGIDFTEGDCSLLSPASGHDLLCGKSSTHRLNMNNHNGGYVQIVAAGVDVNTSDQVTNGSHITNSSIPNTGLVNTGMTIDGQTCTLGSTCTVGTNGTAATGNTTAVTVNANTTGDQILQELHPANGAFNSGNIAFVLHQSGIYTTAAISTPTITLKAKMCTQTAGGGTCITLFTNTTIATVSATNNQFVLDGSCGTKTTGATGNLICHAGVPVDLTAASVTATVFTDANTTNSSNYDLTGANFIIFTIAFSAGSASNTATGQLAYVSPLGMGGTVTSVAGGTGISGGTITATGTLATDPTVVCQPGSFATQTDGATVTWAIASAMCANAALTFTVHSGSRTLNITNPTNGGSYVLWIKQDSTGGEGLTLGTGCTWKVSGGGAGAVTPSTGASAIDVLAFTYDGTNCYANFNKNFN